MLTVSLERTQESVECSKRQNAPYKLLWTCPQCKTAQEHSFLDNYLMYPNTGEAHEVGLYCKSCEHEDSVSLRFDIVLTLVCPTAPDPSGG